MIHKAGSFNTIRLVKVCYVYPEGHQFDGLFLDTGEYCRCIQMMSSYAGTDFGFASGIPAPEEEGYDENRETDPNRRNVIVVVASIATGYIGLGFLFPQVNHLAFTKARDKNRMIERHPSDFYRTIDDAANMDMVHPSNAYITVRVGDTPDDLSGRDYDGRYQIKHNTNQEVTIAVVNRSNKTTYIKLLPEGDIRIYAEKKVVIQAGESISLTAPAIYINGDIEHTGNNNQTGVHTDSNGLHAA